MIVLLADTHCIRDYLILRTLLNTSLSAQWIGKILLFFVNVLGHRYDLYGFQEYCLYRLLSGGVIMKLVETIRHQRDAM